MGLNRFRQFVSLDFQISLKWWEMMSYCFWIRPTFWILRTVEHTCNLLGHGWTSAWCSALANWNTPFIEANFIHVTFQLGKKKKKIHLILTSWIAKIWTQIWSYMRVMFTLCHTDLPNSSVTLMRPFPPWPLWLVRAKVNLKERRTKIHISPG